MKIIKHIATIRAWKNISLELNLIEWGNNKKAKYDLRCWEGAKALKGVTLQKEDLLELYNVIAEEFGLQEEIELTYEGEEERLPVGISNNKNEPLGGHQERQQEHFSEDLIESEVVLDYRSVIVHDKFGACILAGHDYEEVEAIVPIYQFTGVKEVRIQA